VQLPGRLKCGSRRLRSKMSTAPLRLASPERVYLISTELAVVLTPVPSALSDQPMAVLGLGLFCAAEEVITSLAEAPFQAPPLNPLAKAERTAAAGLEPV